MKIYCHSFCRLYVIEGVSPKENAYIAMKKY